MHQNLLRRLTAAVMNLRLASPPVTSTAEEFPVGREIVKRPKALRQVVTYPVPIGPYHRTVGMIIHRVISVVMPLRRVGRRRCAGRDSCGMRPVV